MFLVWGSKGFIENLGTTGINCSCSNCQNDVTLEAKRIGRKFTLFWIPLFPTSSKYYLLCPICQYGNEVSREMMKKYLAGTAE